jgi:hypothetical protein
LFGKKNRKRGWKGLEPGAGEAHSAFGVAHVCCSVRFEGCQPGILVRNRQLQKEKRGLSASLACCFCADVL